MSLELRDERSDVVPNGFYFDRKLATNFGCYLFLIEAARQQIQDSRSDRIQAVDLSPGDIQQDRSFWSVRSANMLCNLDHGRPRRGMSPAVRDWQFRGAKATNVDQRSKILMDAHARRVQATGAKLCDSREVCGTSRIYELRGSRRTTPTTCPTISASTRLRRTMGFETPSENRCTRRS